MGRVCCRALVVGVVLFVALASPTMAQAAPGWSATGAMSVERYHHTDTMLPNGKVLVAGGRNLTLTDLLASAELYDPTTATWSVTASMSVARAEHTATLMFDGRVLVAGGANQDGMGVASAEIYDPATATWTSTQSMSVGRSNHTATLLPTGNVLVTGGEGTASAELYDPTAGTWSAVANMAEARADHTATLLADGTRVLVAGGGEFGFSDTATAELYDVATGTWSAAPPMSRARFFYGATLLASGQVLVSGGISGNGGTATAEIYSPTTNSWSAAGSMSTDRGDYTPTLLANGKVLAAGGQTNVGPVSSADLYDPASNSWSPTQDMGIRRGGATATLLPSGVVLVAGGYTNNSANASAQLYTIDAQAPLAPVLTGSDPVSPANDNSPRIKGTAETGSTVRLYTNASCNSSGPEVGSAATFASPGLAVSVANDSSTTFYATATDTAGNESACSSGLTYVEDSSAPAAPAVTDSDPDSPANDNAPRIKGTAETGSTVRLYTNASCNSSGPEVGSAATFASPGLAVSVANDSSTTFYATATDTAGNESACSSGLTYVEDSTAPSVTLVTPAQGAVYSILDNPVADYSCADPGGSGLASCTGTLPDGAPVPHGLFDLGQHTFTVTATDNAGNSTTVSHTYRVTLLGLGIGPL